MTESLEALMRAAHSLKGAARIVSLQAAVRIAHAMEDCFVAAQQGNLLLRESEIDVLFRGVDLLAHISKRTEANIAAWETDHEAEIAELLASLKKLMPAGLVTESPASNPAAPPATSGSPASPAEICQEQPASLPAIKPTARREGSPHPAVAQKPEDADRVLRLTAENLNRLLGLAGESLAESRWLRPFADSLLRLKRRHADLAQGLDHLCQSLEADHVSERAMGRFNQTVPQAGRIPAIPGRPDAGTRHLRPPLRPSLSSLVS